MERRIETERLILRTVTVEDAGDDMRFEIERINEENYPGFDDMVFWRENGEGWLDDICTERRGEDE